MIEFIKETAEVIVDSIEKDDNNVEAFKNSCAKTIENGVSEENAMKILEMRANDNAESRKFKLKKNEQTIRGIIAAGGLAGGYLLAKELIKAFITTSDLEREEDEETEIE